MSRHDRRPQHRRGDLHLHPHEIGSFRGGHAASTRVWLDEVACGGLPVHRRGGPLPWGSRQSMIP